MIRVGQTFFIPTGGKEHLFFVVLGPLDLEDSPKQQFLLVNATTVRENDPQFDDSCVLQVGDHPFIKHASYIAYRSARLEAARHIESVLGTVFRPGEDCSKEVLQRIIEGAKKSRRLRRDLKDLFCKIPL